VTRYTTTMPHTPLFVAERLDLIDLVEDLEPEEWEVPSLCRRWRVRDVVAHLVSYEGQSATALASRALRAGLLPNRMSELGVRELAGVPTAELVARLRAHVDPSGPARMFGGQLGLTDGVIHQQDIRRPLGRPRHIPAQRLRDALDFALTAPPLRGAWRARGLRVVTEDIGWTHGRDPGAPEVRGPGEAVLMALAGRPAALPDLDGDGVAILARRIR
jgi:uncharacterized protein (TIGR03083 family)